MPAFHVRDVPDTVLAALRERAARHQRSVQEEVRRRSRHELDDDDGR